MSLICLNKKNFSLAVALSEFAKTAKRELNMFKVTAMQYSN
jgi:hypothetical protein